MSIYKRLGIEPIIDCASTTRFGGVLASQEVIDAMAEAAKETVRLDELQEVASTVIAELTGAEAGIVTSGASAALTLGTAACMTGLDVGRMNRLPDTAGMPNEVLMAKYHLGQYEHAIRAAGAKIITVDVPNQLYSPSRAYLPEAWEYEAAITNSTAAIAYTTYRGEVTYPPLDQIIERAKKHNIPVLVDAAVAVPPRENLRKYISAGADLVAISGGKGLKGPQASGILCGRRDLVASACLQMMDMASLSFETWDPPSSLIPKEKLRGLPQHGIGRGMKVTKEAIVGLLTALKLYAKEKSLELIEKQRVLLELVAGHVQGIPGIEITWVKYNPDARSMLQVRLDRSESGRTVEEVTRKLREGSPRIYVRGDPTQYRTPFIPQDTLIVDGFNLNERQAEIVGKRLREAILP